jgi:hypothetical protein
MAGQHLPTEKGEAGRFHKSAIEEAVMRGGYAHVSYILGLGGMVMKCNTTSPARENNTKISITYRV